MFPLESEYKSLLPRNAHGTYKAACTISMIADVLANLLLKSSLRHIILCKFSVWFVAMETESPTVGKIFKN